MLPRCYNYREGSPLASLIITVIFNVYLAFYCLGFSADALLDYHYVIVLVTIMLNIFTAITYITIYSLITLNIYWVITTAFVLTNVIFLIYVIDIMASTYEFIFSQFMLLIVYLPNSNYNLNIIDNLTLANYTYVFAACVKFISIWYDYLLYGSNQFPIISKNNPHCYINPLVMYCWYMQDNIGIVWGKAYLIYNLAIPYIFSLVKIICDYIDWLIILINGICSNNTSNVQLGSLSVFDNWAITKYFWVGLITTYTEFIDKWLVILLPILEPLYIDVCHILTANINYYKHMLNEINSLYDILLVIWNLIIYIYNLIIVITYYISGILTYMYIIASYILQIIIDALKLTLSILTKYIN